MENIKDIKDMYIVSTISLKPKTEDDLKREYEIYKVKYSSWKDKTFEQFYEFQEDWDWHRYNMSQEDNSYFLDLEKAKKSVKGNFADINDGGSYNYAVIKKVSLSRAYAMIHVEELYIFKYDREKDEYVEVSLECDDDTKYITSIISPQNAF